MALREALNKIKAKYGAPDTSVPLRDRLAQAQEVQFGVPEAKKPWLVEEKNAQETPETNNLKGNPLEVLGDGVEELRKFAAPKIEALSEKMVRTAGSGIKQAATAVLSGDTELPVDLNESAPQEVVPAPDSNVGKEARIEVIPSPYKAIDKTKIKFQEATSTDGIPYVENDDGSRVSIKDIRTDFPETKRIKKIKINDKRPGHSEEITDPAKLEVANKIKRVADAVAPEYTDYLLRLAKYEGAYNDKQRLYMFNDTYTNDKGKKVHYSSRDPKDAEKYGGIWSVDRGIFQINSAAFPSISDELADDVEKSTLWAISLIEAGKQDKWYADKYVKKAKTEIEYEE
jgi:hypothetical protein